MCQLNRARRRRQPYHAPGTTGLAAASVLERQKVSADPTCPRWGEATLRNLVATCMPQGAKWPDPESEHIAT